LVTNFRSRMRDRESTGEVREGKKEVALKLRKRGHGTALVRGKGDSLKEERSLPVVLPRRTKNRRVRGMAGRDGRPEGRRKPGEPSANSKKRERIKS